MSCTYSMYVTFMLIQHILICVWCVAITKYLHWVPKWFWPDSCISLISWQWQWLEMTLNTVLTSNGGKTYYSKKLFTSVAHYLPCKSLSKHRHPRNPLIANDNQNCTAVVGGEGGPDGSKALLLSQQQAFDQLGHQIRMRFRLRIRVSNNTIIQ